MSKKENNNVKNDELEQEKKSAQEQGAEPELSETEALKLENSELNDKLLRHVAEFDNFKKRTQKEKEELMVYSKTLCIGELLTVVDNFERALETESTDSEFKKGVEMIFAQLMSTLTKLGVEEIEALNAAFDPEYHNAINQVEDENFGENTISQVFQKGYKIGDKVIRHSMVTVANP